MSIEELLEQLISDRIEMLFASRPESVKSRDLDTANREEAFLEALGPEIRSLAEKLIDEIIYQMGEENRYIYLCGIDDGIKIANHVLKR